MNPADDIFYDHAEAIRPMLEHMELADININKATMIIIDGVEYETTGPLFRKWLDQCGIDPKDEAALTVDALCMVIRHLRTQIETLTKAICPDNLPMKTVVALAYAQRQDSDLVDENLKAIARLGSQIETLTQEREDLRTQIETLKGYVQHKFTCEKVRGRMSISMGGHHFSFKVPGLEDCTCGLDAQINTK